MADPAMTAVSAPDAVLSGVGVPSVGRPNVDGSVGESAPCPVAETMRRVQAQLRSGAAPTFDALLAYGVPAAR